MSGTFDKTSRPALAGSYFNWEAEAEETPTTSLGGLVGVVLSTDSGPVNQIVSVRSVARYKQLFGATKNPALRWVTWLFRGENLPGKGGVTELLVYRAATAEAEFAAVTLNNTASNPALTITSKFKGTRGNAYRITVQAGTTGGTKELLVIDGTAVVEKYTFTSTAIDVLAEEITAVSKLIDADSLVSGVALADATSVQLADGNNGEVLTNTEHVAAQAAFEQVRVGGIALPGVTSPSTVTSWAAWTASVNDRGKRLWTLAAGPNDDTIVQYGTRAKAINDPDFRLVGGSKLRDDSDGTVLEPADQVAMVAGSIASRGERKDLIFARFGGVSFVSGPDLNGQEYAVANGVITFSKDTNAAAPVFIREGTTTYSDDSLSEVVDGVKTHPVEQYRRIKVVATQHAVEMEVDEWATSGAVLGDLEVSDSTRGIILGYVKVLLQNRVDQRIIMPGFTVELDREPEPDDRQDYVQYRWGFRPTRSVRQLFTTARIG